MYVSPIWQLNKIMENCTLSLIIYRLERYSDFPARKKAARMPKSNTHTHIYMNIFRHIQNNVKICIQNLSLPLSPHRHPAGPATSGPAKWSHDHATRCIIYTVSISLSLLLSLSMHIFFVIYIYICNIYTYIHML